MVIVAGTSWTGGTRFGSSPSETVVAADAGASARTLLLWISEKFLLFFVLSFTFSDESRSDYSFLKG